MTKNELLNTITKLSHEFGSCDYVLGGGGNTSAKNEQTLWIKPSGTTLAGLKPELFVALDRTRLSELYAFTPPAVPAEREELIKNAMAAAVSPETPGRASVEAPLHDSLSATFVVHTHPAIVNGMTCSLAGKKACVELFPDALWLDYIDPGYTLCMKVRQEIKSYKDCNGKEPALIFLKNHGLFVAADTADEIRQLYSRVVNTLLPFYKKAGIKTTLKVGSDPTTREIDEKMRRITAAYKNDDLGIAVSGMFAYPQGPITPDHIVYAKSFPFIGEPDQEAIKAFSAKHGYNPAIIATKTAVYGVADTEKKAALALLLAQDGALVIQLANAFGGIDYMTDDARIFIENWEVESYRSKQM